MRLWIGIGKFSLLDFITNPKKGEGNNYYSNCVFGQPMPIILDQKKKNDDVIDIPSESFKKIADEISREVKIEPSTIEYILKLAAEFGNK
jgi:hypothetical protein